MAVIEAESLVVRYGARTAVNGVSLRVEEGEVVALVGPNGAGKTSTMETLEGYRRPAAGRCSVLGADPRAGHGYVVAKLGVMLQRGGVYPALSPVRALKLYASYYREPEDPASLMRRLSLDQVARTPWRQLSGGEQQRLALALCLVGRPSAVLLDEPTAGVDPEGRIAIREVVKELSRRGAAVLLSTHELDEAERLGDRIAVMAAGSIVAEGTPATLAGAQTEIRFKARPGLPVTQLAGEVGAEVSEAVPGEYRVGAEATPRAVAAVASWLASRGVEITDLRAGRPTLEEVFLGLTAREREGDEGQAPASGAVAAVSGRRVVRRRGPRAPAKAVLAQTRAEVAMTLRRADSLLLALGIPVTLLVFFSLVHVLPLPPGTRQPVDFLTPGILSLAIMSTGLVSLAIATGFERSYGVLKRLGSTPLGRPALMIAKTAAVLVVEMLQVVVLGAVAWGLGWRPQGAAGVGLAALVLGTAAFSGLGLWMAGTLRAEVTLAAANGAWLALLLLGGMVVPLYKLPSGLAALARALPAAALTQALDHAFGQGAGVPAEAWVVLGAWGVAAPVVAALSFRWE